MSVVIEENRLSLQYWTDSPFSSITTACDTFAIPISVTVSDYHIPWAHRVKSLESGWTSFPTPEEISQLQAWKVESEPILLVMNCKVSFCWRRQWRSVSCPKCGRKQKPEYFRGPTDRGQWIECMQIPRLSVILVQSFSVIVTMDIVINCLLSQFLSTIEVRNGNLLL